MKKNLIFASVVVLVFIAIIFAFGTAEKTENVVTFSKSELGLEFKYKTGDDGYVLEEMAPFEKTADFLRVIVLMRSEDIKKGMPAGGEGPPSITISVFRNLKKQPSLEWANERIQYSNINLKTGEVATTVVGGAKSASANAIRYTADGLYASDNVVVAHGENVYVFSGMYIDAESAIKKDFSPLIDSVKFIPSGFPTKYIHAEDWPPVVRVENGPFTCTETRESVAMAGRMTKKTIDGRVYCVTLVSEGTAGSIYTQYTYATAIKDKVALFTFTTRTVQCDNYSDPEKGECKKEQAEFNLDALVNEVVKNTEIK